MGHHFPSVGKYWEKHWEYSVLKTNTKLLFWENIGLRSQEKFLFSYFGIKLGIKPNLGKSMGFFPHPWEFFGKS